MWNYVTPGIPDEMFERLPGIPLSKKETRLLIISLLRLKSDSLLWDIGAGTGTIPIECGLICPKGKIIAVERDEDVAKLIKRNSDRFGVSNIEIVEGNAPDCIKDLPMKPDRVCIEGGKVIKEILSEVWKYLEKEGRIVITAVNLETLYAISESLAHLQARNIEVVQSAVNRLEKRGNNQVFAGVDPIFIISGEKID